VGAARLGGKAGIDGRLELVDQEAQVGIGARLAGQAFGHQALAHRLGQVGQELLGVVLAAPALAVVPHAHHQRGRDAARAHQPIHREVDVPGLLVPGDALIEHHLSVVHVQHGVAARGGVVSRQPHVHRACIHVPRGRQREALDAAYGHRGQWRLGGLRGGAHEGAGPRTGGHRPCRQRRGEWSLHARHFEPRLRRIRP
jgi:hypothetical protein